MSKRNEAALVALSNATGESVSEVVRRLVAREATRQVRIAARAKRAEAAGGAA